MKTFEKQAAQGDVLFRRIGVLPTGVAHVPPVDGRVVVAHSETGHHHAFEAEAENVFLYSTSDELVSYLEIKKPAVLKHYRMFDQHEEILFEQGIYEIRRQREWSPDGWRRVED